MLWRVYAGFILEGAPTWCEVTTFENRTRKILSTSQPFSKSCIQIKLPKKCKNERRSEKVFQSSAVVCQMLTPRQLRHSFRASHQSKSVAESITITVIRSCAPFSWIGSLLTDSLQHALLPEKTLAISQSTSHWTRPTRSKSRWFCRMTWRPPTLWSTCPRLVIHTHTRTCSTSRYTIYNVQYTVKTIQDTTYKYYILHITYYTLHITYYILHSTYVYYIHNIYNIYNIYYITIYYKLYTYT